MRRSAEARPGEPALERASVLGPSLPGGPAGPRQREDVRPARRAELTHSRRVRSGKKRGRIPTPPQIEATSIIPPATNCFARHRRHGSDAVAGRRAQERAKPRRHRPLECPSRSGRPGRLEQRMGALGAPDQDHPSHASRDAALVDLAAADGKRTRPKLDSLHAGCLYSLVVQLNAITIVTYGHDSLSLGRGGPGR